jgi:hypothetical protein
MINIIFNYLTHNYKIHLPVLLLFLLCTEIKPQDFSNARSLGMGFSTVTSSFGTDAFSINPANFDNHKPLTLKDKKTKNKKQVKSQPVFELAFLSVGGGYGSDNSFNFFHNYTEYLTVNYTDIVNFFTDVNSTLEFKQNVLPEEETNVNFDFEIKWLSFNYASPLAGAFNFTVADKVNLTSVVSGKDEFLNFTTTSNSNGSYNINNFRLEQKESSAWWIRKYSAGYAKQFDFDPKSVIRSIAIGFSAAFVHGFGSITTSRINLVGDTWGISSVNGVNHIDSIRGASSHFIQSSSTDLFRGYGDGRRTRFSLFPDPAGKGYSFDFGVALRITDKINIAASVTDLGKIKWDYNTFVSNDNNPFVYYDFNVNENDPVYNAFLNDLKGTNTRDSNIVFETDMPTKYRAGISVKPVEMFLIEFNWMNEKSIIPGRENQNLYSLGAELVPVSFIPLRAGISYGRNDEFNISLGAGIRLLHFSMDAGVYGLNQLVLGKRFFAALTTKVFF